MLLDAQRSWFSAGYSGDVPLETIVLSMNAMPMWGPAVALQKSLGIVAPPPAPSGTYTVTDADISKALLSIGNTPFVAGQIIVKFDIVSTYPSLDSAMSAVQSAFPQLGITKGILISNDTGVLHVTPSDNTSTIAAFLLIQKHPAVKYAELNLITKIDTPITPGTTFTPGQESPIGKDTTSTPAPAAKYVLLVNGAPVGSYATTEETVQAVGANSKIGDRVEIKNVGIEQTTVSYFIRTSTGVVDVPVDQQAAVAAMTQEEVQQTVIKAEADQAAEQAAKPSGGFPWWILAAGVAAKAIL
jgi:hypothetical protein